MSYVITASATADGNPLYLTQGSEWSRELQDAVVLESDESRDSMLAIARRAEFTVCDPYAIEIDIQSGTLAPLTLKERIRAEGPTVAYGS